MKVGDLVYAVYDSSFSSPYVAKARVSYVSDKRIVIENVTNPKHNTPLAFRCQNRFKPDQLGTAFFLTPEEAKAFYFQCVKDSITRKEDEIVRLRAKLDVKILDEELPEESFILQPVNP